MTHTVSYTPGVYEGGSIENYLFQELQRISEIITPVADGAMDKRHVLPEKPRSGLFYADGTDWDPGEGVGVYRYDDDTNTFEKLGGGAPGITGLGIWRYRTETATPPVSGQIRFDNVNISAATEFYLHETNDNGTDVSTFLGVLISVGSVLFIQDQSDADNYVLIEISSIVDSGVYRTYGIANIVEGGTEPSQNTRVMLIAAGGAASSPVASVFGRTGAVTALQADYDSFFLTTAEANALYSVLAHTHTGSTISALDAGDTTTGAFADARIPSLNASKITAGTFAFARIPASSQAEAEAGTDNTEFLTPLRTAQAMRQTGTWAPTWTGFGTNPTGNLRWQIISGEDRGWVMISDDTGVQITGLSNATTFTITGIPTIIRPTTAVQVRSTMFEGISSGFGGQTCICRITAAGVITFRTGLITAGFFTLSGTNWNNDNLAKGLTQGCQFMYPLYENG